MLNNRTTLKMRQFIIVNDGRENLSYVIPSNDKQFAELTNDNGLDEDKVLRNLSEFRGENLGLAKSTATRVECGEASVELIAVNEEDLKEVLKVVNYSFRYNAHNAKEQLLAFVLGDNFTDLVEFNLSIRSWMAK